MTVETRYEHIVLNDASVPLIAGTTMKVIELVTAQQAYGWSAEELLSARHQCQGRAQPDPARPWRGRAGAI